MNTIIEIKNKYRMTLWEALAVMAENPEMEFQYDDICYKIKEDVLLYKGLISGRWDVSISHINDLTGAWYPVYPYGTAEWAVVQMYQGKIIQVGKCYYRLENDELLVWDKDEQTWQLSIRRSFDEFIEVYSTAKFKVVDSVPEPEPSPEEKLMDIQSALRVFFDDIDNVNTDYHEDLESAAVMKLRAFAESE